MFHIEIDLDEHLRKEKEKKKRTEKHKNFRNKWDDLIKDCSVPPSTPQNGMTRLPKAQKKIGICSKNIEEMEIQKIHGMQSPFEEEMLEQVASVLEQEIEKNPKRPKNARRKSPPRKKEMK